jgi:hypothetical protein
MSLFGDNVTLPMSAFPDTLQVQALSLLPDSGVNALSGLQPHFVSLISVALSGGRQKKPHKRGLMIIG